MRRPRRRPGGRDVLARSRSPSPPAASRKARACAASTTPPARCWPARRRPGARASSSALVGLAFLRPGRARVYMQIVGTDFYQKQGEKRFAHTLEVPASRGRILDRNGLVLATSVPVPSVWAIPREGLRRRRAQRKAAGQAAGHEAGRAGRAAGQSAPSSPGCAARSTSRCGSRSRRWASRACYEVREYKRRYPEGEAAAHVVGFTTSRRGQEGIELRFQAQLQGQGRLAHGAARPPGPRRSRTSASRSTRSTAATSAGHRLQGAVLRLPAPARRRAEHKAKAGSVVVLDVQTGEVLALANYPSYDPGAARNLSGRAAAQPRADRHLRARLDDEALRRRAGARDRPRHADTP
jgi:cell division protein FtsI (penicillin-binding protein 3)